MDVDDFYFEDIGGERVEDRVRSLLDQGLLRAAQIGTQKPDELLRLADDLYTAIDDAVEIEWPE